ncbi:hypothetical protein HWV01_13120 [Moritella sp. 5]|uniref:hypothetical protein n=1 Tax=Moritella sp. 5 TaxID=2746231 RepID=UPI001BAB5098|nr:hypothetical protein [Moritella sp. 5]QUM81160.1 hypothetical protein HWV01_13120 [Moritella sp. 5]
MAQGKELVIQTVQLSTISDVLAIILSIVALAITVIGFFASLKFYRDGVELQKSANTALTKIEEKMASLQTHVGGMFEKTLDAAINKPSELDKTFDDLDNVVEEAKKSLLDAAKKELGEIGSKETSKLKDVLNEQMHALEMKVNEARNVAEFSTPSEEGFQIDSKIVEEILTIMKSIEQPMSLNKIRKIIGGELGNSRALKLHVHHLVGVGVLDKKKREGEDPYPVNYSISTNAIAA